jgi:hypothetical protein
MIDPQLDSILQQMLQLQLDSVWINATALVAIMSGLLMLGLSIRLGFQDAQASLERIAQMTTQILREIRER